MSPIYKKRTLITGGVRSGKSRYALEMVRKASGKKAFIATAQAFDEGMAVRIQKHKEERGSDFITIEEPVYLAQAVTDASAQAPVVIIDCLTVWLNNLLYHFKDDQTRINQQRDLFLNVLAHPPAEIIMVTNEIGLGVMPDNRTARAFVDALGSINQKAAAYSDDVIMMVAGLPQIIKGIPYESMDHTRREYSAS